jgi:D-amino-acid dehydrogenase
MIIVTADTHDGVLIIGGGVIGLSIAEALQRHDVPVTILDASIGSVQASQGNAGQIAPGHPPIPSPAVPPRALSMLLDRRSPLYIPPRPSMSLARWLLAFRRACRPTQYEHAMKVLGAMSHDSRDGFDRLSESLNAGDLLHAVGVTDFWRTEQGQADAMEETQWMETLGFEVEHLTGQALRARDPGWSDSVLGAVIHQDGLIVDPAAWLTSLRTKVLADGATLCEHVTVRDIQRSRGTWDVMLADDRTVTSGKLVLCAGSWTPPLARHLGMRILMEPAKGYHSMATMDTPPRLAGVLRESKIAITPLNGMVRIAGTLELSGLNHRRIGTRLDQLITGARPYLPGLTKANVQTNWCGLRPCTPDGLPIIGPVPDAPNAWIATGHGMMGLTLAPATGEVIAADILGQPLPEWAPAMRPSRA